MQLRIQKHILNIHHCKQYCSRIMVNLPTTDNRLQYATFIVDCSRWMLNIIIYLRRAYIHIHDDVWHDV